MIFLQTYINKLMFILINLVKFLIVLTLILLKYNFFVY